MNAEKLYQKMEIDFELGKCRDDWSEIQWDQELISENFKKRFMGILADNATEIKKIYTAVFPSEKIIQELIKRQEKDVLLFTHHPVDWKMYPGKPPFVNFQKESLEKLKAQKISIYTLHTPLDRNGEYSTSVNFAKAMQVSPESEFAEYFGFFAGIIGRTNYAKISELAEIFSAVVCHRVKTWNYGTEEIKNYRVAVVAGGGNAPEIIREVIKLGINTLITGVTFPNPHYQPSLEAHRLAQENKINIIGGTHYSTEKFACIKMLDYFQKFNLPVEFLEDNPDLGDLE